MLFVGIVTETMFDAGQAQADVAYSPAGSGGYSKLLGLSDNIQVIMSI